MDRHGGIVGCFDRAIGTNRLKTASFFVRVPLYSITSYKWGFPHPGKHTLAVTQFENRERERGEREKCLWDIRVNEEQP